MRFVFVLSFILLLPSFSFAWGFETHINIGLRILENTLFSLIKNYPVHFLLGNIFPDFFNLFKDVSSFKKSLETHSWDTVSALFKSAVSDGEKSFAHGYAAHLSADIVAHHYFVPHHMLLVSKKRIFSHFLPEYAEESISNKKTFYTLVYLLDNSVVYGEIFLRVFNVPEAYFVRQVKMLKLGLNYQHIMKASKIAETVKTKNVAQFRKRCEYFNEQAYSFAKHAVEKGFLKFVKYEASGKKRMSLAKKQRDYLVEDIGKSDLKKFDKEHVFINTHKPDFDSLVDN